MTGAIGLQLSIGDLVVVCRLQLFGYLEGFPSDLLDSYPLLLALVERVESEPRIVSYRKLRAAAENWRSS